MKYTDAVFIVTRYFNQAKLKSILPRYHNVPIYISGDEVEMVKSFKFLGVQITNNLSWSLDHSNQPPIHSLCLHFPLPRKSSQHNEGPNAPWTFSLPTSSIGKKIQKSEDTNQPTQKQLFESDF